MKSVNKLFLGIFLLVFLSSGVFAVGFGTCSIVARNNCIAANGDDIVMGLSATTNAHGQASNGGSYPYVLCCNFANQTAMTNCVTSPSNEIIGLSQTTNAHGEIPSRTTYTFPACYRDFSCSPALDICPNKTLGVLSLSVSTNAHIGPYNGTGSYATKICCGGVSVANSLCKIKSATWSVVNSIEGQGVRLVVTGSSAADCSGVKVSFNILEKDVGSYQNALMKPVDIAFNKDTATGIWYSEYQDDGTFGGDPEYVFNVSITKNPMISMLSSNELSVAKSAEFCATVTSCEDYISKDTCESDTSLCQVSEFSSLPEVNCDSESVVCGCVWNAEQASCGFGWGEIEDAGTPETGCKFGATLCLGSNGTYCHIGSTCPAGEEPTSNNNGTCDAGEGCSSADCKDGDTDTCAEGLYCSSGKCGSVLSPISLEVVGNCKITQSIEKSCEEEPVGYKIISWTGEWTGNQTGSAYTNCIAGGRSTVPCAAQVQLPFFDGFELIVTVLVLGSIYFLLLHKKEHHKKKKN